MQFESCHPLSAKKKNRRRFLSPHFDTLSVKQTFSFQSIRRLSPHTNAEVIFMAKKE
jgi:hypothetical protein